MATTLATTRTAVLTALASVTTIERYRRRQTNYQYPCAVVGWPQEFDVRPVMGDARDFTIDVHIACEVIDDDSSDDLLSSILESVVTALQGTPAWDVQPVTDFGESLLDDNRVVVWCRLPLAVLT